MWSVGGVWRVGGVWSVGDVKGRGYDWEMTITWTA